MSKLIWLHDYSVQIPAIDNEHKLLVELINEFSSSLDTHGAFQAKIVTESLKKLSCCIKQHFESEERFLMFNNYPDFDAHKQEHDLLLDQIKRFEQRFKTEKKAFNEKMLLFLKDWLVRHIILHDIKFGVYFRDKELINNFG
ncbi:MAG: hemerythrin family protein [Desulfuromonadales bacterium]|nr:hemerythrin family protein [Desulfuromonadales bacterium]